MRHRGLDAPGLEQIEARQELAEVRAEALEQHDGRGGVIDREPKRHTLPHRRTQTQDRRRDDAEGALRADQQLLHVVAGVVLAQRREAS